MERDFFSGELSVEAIPQIGAVIVEGDTDIVYREEGETAPLPIPGTSHNYIPWGGDNQLPYKIIDRVEEDETLTVCHDFQSEALFAGGLDYVCDDVVPDAVREMVEDFTLDNNLAEYHLGICRDLRMFEFAVTVLILSMDGMRILSMVRKEAAYCRFSAPEDDGRIRYVHYADWRRSVGSERNPVETIVMLDMRNPRASLEDLAERGVKKVAYVTRLPSKDSLIYPIPSYAAIFRGRWYRIKRKIAIAKEAAIRNSTRLKYLIEISQGYWDRHFRENNIIDPAEKLQEVNRIKQQMIDFITGAENSGKALFATFMSSPDGRAEIHDVKITSLESQKEGGDWSADHAESVNMLCFAMRVHSNLVGSVPGKSQMNNSGSDKRELYTIAQAMQQPYRKIAAHLHRIVIRYNGWRGVRVTTPLLQLTTLDEHKDVKESGK